MKNGERHTIAGELNKKERGNNREIRLRKGNDRVEASMIKNDRRFYGERREIDKKKRVKWQQLG